MMDFFRRRKNKYISLVLLLCLIILLLAGCWDRTEVNDLAIILATGVDISKNKEIELSVQVFIPKPAEGGQQGGVSSGSTSSQTLVRSAEGVTIADAMSRLQEKLTRRIFWGQNEVLIIGEKLAKKGIGDQIDFWMGHTDPRERADVFVSMDSAKEVLESMPELERDAAKQLSKLVDSQIGVKVTVKDLSEMLTGDSSAAVIPWVAKMSPSNLEVNEGKNIPFIKGSAVLKGDKMVGRLSDKESRGILWPRNEMKSGIITISLKDEKGFVSLNLLRSHNQLIPKISNGNWSIMVKTDTDLEVIQNTTNLNLLNLKSSKKVKRMVVQEIEERERLTLSKARKKMNADIFGFAGAFHRDYPGTWKRKKNEWSEIFRKVDVTFDTKVNIRRTGLSNEKAKKGGGE
ncbi:Ger(x)C family spore germination protein [Neobacillus novalis]|uniref:Ger(X)C family spore germination protein n=1 Tax=Neobacillus novalis TaxID=220687 RepID=A0AA95MUS9_9BACI|nr:Ger(x)C family spore germination protein [Neobacillus novalis]WHY87741.1 Ger(x)C family spore germination protein [Neobacillus novalis]